MPLTKPEVLHALKSGGWVVEEDGRTAFALPEPPRSRYPLLPPELAGFLAGLTVCANAGQTAWFLCQDDFAPRGEQEWRWNEFELMLLEWSETAQERQKVVEFFDAHIPFLLSAHTGYAFFAVSLRPETWGQVVYTLLVYGVDEPTTVAASFGEFLSLLLVGEFPAEVGDILPVAV